MAVILRDVEGFSTSEVAEILGSSESTVRSQICRGRLRIKEAMDRKDGRAFMNCNRTKESLALYAGGDLPAAEADKTSAHLQECAECRQFYEGLASNQSLLRSLRQTTGAPAQLWLQCARNCFPGSRRPRSVLGWWIRIERFLLIESRRPRLAVAGVALAVDRFGHALCPVAARHRESRPCCAVFEGTDILRLPGGLS